MAQYGAGITFHSTNLKVNPDTPAKWVQLFGRIGVFFVSYTLGGMFAGQPGQYGVLTTNVLDSNQAHATIRQTWHSWLGREEVMRASNNPNAVLSATWTKVNS